LRGTQPVEVDRPHLHIFVDFVPYDLAVVCSIECRK
jgi:hypothetical protein